MEDIYLIPLRLKPFNLTIESIYLKDIYCIYPKEYAKKIGNICIRYYENKDYVFTHGFIPTDKKVYRADWRDACDKEWRNAAARGDAMMLSMRYGISEPNKKIVCGHYSAARCYMMKNATEADWDNKIYKDVSGVPAEGFKPFFGDTFIAIDQSVKKKGFVNCIVIEE